MFFVARLLPAVLVGSLVFGVGSQQTAWPAPAPGPASRADVQADLFRGLADIFSRGMDTLTHRLNQEGYSARVYSTNQWPSAAQRIADQYYAATKSSLFSSDIHWAAMRSLMLPTNWTKGMFQSIYWYRSMQQILVPCQRTFSMWSISFSRTVSANK